LFITYQIALSKKYLEELQTYGFVNYLDRKDKYTIIDKKLIICLDSLKKVNTKNFDYIFIDETMSVLLHFNSPLIRDINSISMLFELLLLQAKYIYLLDACIDNTIVYNMVKYLESKKNCNSYWIYNTMIRPSNRYANISYNKKTKYKKALSIMCIEYIINTLKQNKNIIVSSSTKTFTEILKEQIKNSCPNIKFMIYNSNTDTKITQEHFINPNDIWINYNCIIYSPTISAGISFTQSHFHELVSYVENSLYTPTVDLALQQMFRVRSLIDGTMSLFINDINNNNFNSYPTNENDIDKWLYIHTQTFNQYFPNDTLSITNGVNTIIKDNNLTFDTSVMSYTLLKSIIYNKNKSLQFFSSLIINTLRNDYNIQCETQLLEFTKDEFDLTNQLLKEYKNKDKINLIFDKKYIINSKLYEFIKTKCDSGIILDEDEKQQKWTYEASVDLWSLPSIEYIDEEFFNDYIGHWSGSDKIIDKYFKMRRFECLDLSIQTNQIKFKQKIENIKNNPDYNFELHRTKIKSHYQRLIEAQNILLYINTERIKIQDRNIFNTNFDIYFETISQLQFCNIIKLFGLKRNNNYKNKEYVDNDTKKLLYVKNILKQSFDIEIEYKNSYRDKLFYNFDKWTNFKTKYHLNNENPEECLFIDEETLSI
jgi:hypothetical protein